MWYLYHLHAKILSSVLIDKNLKPRFMAIELGFAVTYYKLQSKTMSQLIVNPYKRGCTPEIDLMSLIVGYSRVQNRRHVRFLSIQQMLLLVHLNISNYWNQMKILEFGGQVLMRMANGSKHCHCEQALLIVNVQIENTVLLLQEVQWKQQPQLQHDDNLEQELLHKLE